MRYHSDSNLGYSFIDSPLYALCAYNSDNFIITTLYTYAKRLRRLIYFLGVILKETTVTFPANKEEILEKIENTLEKGTRLACFGHIPSNYPVIMPVEEIVKLCHSKGVPVLIDGAHALGSLPLNLAGLEADYYVANAHKWLACPKVLCNVAFCFQFLIIKVCSCSCRTKGLQQKKQRALVTKLEGLPSLRPWLLVLGILAVNKFQRFVLFPQQIVQINIYIILIFQI